MTAGRLITIEGLDGAGKSTLTATLSHEIAARGVSVAPLREPGGVPISERLRELVKDPALSICARTEALLYAAARAQLVQEKINPLLDGGAFVLLDRFVDSSLAYQGAGRDLGIGAIRTINQFATGGLIPDRTLLLRIDPTAGRARQRTRAQAPDRLELEDERFFTAIARAYDELAAREPDRIRVIDAELSPEDVLQASLTALEDLLPPSSHLPG